MSRIRQGASSASDSFFREYTAGLSRATFQRLFDRDAAQRLRGAHPRAQPGARAERAARGASSTAAGSPSSASPTSSRRPAGCSSRLAVLLLLGLVERPTIVLTNKRRVSSSTSRPFWFGVSVAAADLPAGPGAGGPRPRARRAGGRARAPGRAAAARPCRPSPGYSFAHSYRTANEVGGDYYDVSPLPDGRVALMVGDASGHGMAAGLVMAIANATLDTALDLDPEPGAGARRCSTAPSAAPAPGAPS